MKKLLFLVIASFLFANNFNIQVSNETLGVYAQANIAQDQFFARGFFLYNDNKNKNNFYLVGIKGEGNIIGRDAENVKASLIMDFVHTKDNSAIPLGIGIYSIVPNLDYLVFIRGEIEYAPKILSFDDANRFSRGDIQVGVQPIENGEVFLGYRNISFDHNYNSVLYIGLGYSF